MIFAKIDLGLPLTGADSVFIRTLPEGRREKEAAVKTTAYEYALDEVWPNPVDAAALAGNAQVTISFSLADAGRVRVSVSDILGNEVTELLNEYRNAGRHAVAFNTGALPSGLYLCRMESGGKQFMRRLMLLR